MNDFFLIVVCLVVLDIFFSLCDKSVNVIKLSRKYSRLYIINDVTKKNYS